MPKKSKQIKDEPSVFRVIVQCHPYKHLTVDFNTKEEAIEYANTLTRDTTVQYGIYEINPNEEYLIFISHKRLISYEEEEAMIRASHKKRK